METDKLSVVVPLLNDAENISSCLDALLGELEPEDELIVVDNGSTDDSVDVVRMYGRPQLLVLPIGRVGAVRNFGVRFSTGGVIGFVDSDCVVREGWRKCAVNRLSRDKTIGALGSRYQLPKNPGWIESVWFSEVNKSSRPSYINGGNLFVRKKIFLEVGGFDEDLSSGEDAELCLRLVRAGYRIIHDENVAVVHLGNPKTVKRFFFQQKWHAVGMLGTFRIDFLDKPFLMSLAFLFSFLVCLVVFVWWIVPPLESVYVCVLLLLFLLWVPFCAVVYRCVSSKNSKGWFGLLFLYLIYFLARSAVIVEWILHKLKLGRQDSFEGDSRK